MEKKFNQSAYIREYNEKTYDRNLEFLVVIDSDEMKALYCGTLEAFALPQSMTEFRRALDKRTVKKSQTIGATKLVIFV